MGRPAEVGVVGQRKQRMINDGAADRGSAWSSEKVAGLVSLRSLLDNWDFRNPVNQRGQREYMCAGAAGWTYGVDRWRASRTCVSLQSGFIKLTAGDIDGYKRFQQPLENPLALLPGKTYTVSMIARVNSITGSWAELRASSGLNGAAFYLGHTPGAAIALAPTKDFQLFTQTFTLPPGHSHFALEILGNTSASFDIDIQAMKLEPGAVPTILNDPPMDFGLELLKCQRHQIGLLPSISAASTGTASRALRHTPQFIYFLVPLPAALRISPTVADIDNAFLVRGAGSAGGALQPGFSFSVHQRGYGLFVSAEKNGHGLADAVLHVRGRTILDANL